MVTFSSNSNVFLSTNVSHFSPLQRKTPINILSNVQEEVDDGLLTVRIGFERTVLEELLSCCLRTMSIGQSCKVTIEEDNNIEDKQGGALLLKISLVSYDNVTPMWRMSDENLLHAAQVLKNMGTDMYKRNLCELAFQRFRNAAHFITPLKHLDSGNSSKKDADRLRVQIYLNLSACHMKYSNYLAVVRNCSSVLEVHGSNVKALYRRAQAYHKTEEYQKAATDIEKALIENPDHAAVKTLLNVVQRELTRSNEKLSKAMNKMFFS